MMSGLDDGVPYGDQVRLFGRAAQGRRTVSNNQAAPDVEAQVQRGPKTIDGVTGEVVADEPSVPRGGSGPDWLKYIPAGVCGLVESHLPPGLPSDAGRGGFTMPKGTPLHSAPARSEAPLPPGAQFLSRTFANAAGSRPYKLYVPSGYSGQSVALVVMLHGCTQSPDDFAAGTGMNEAAEHKTFLVAYPGQTALGHPQRCWKWFNAEDQRRGAGEPSLIADITLQIMQDYAVDPRRVYVAGLSAGGAAAAVMADAYPDLYAAVGVHSGLACGAASNTRSALAAMQRGGADAVRRKPQLAGARLVPTIVFHGDRDTTVSPRNGDEVVGRSAGDATTRTQVTTGRVEGGHAFSRTLHLDREGQTLTEQWVVHGAGHAWSGGSKAGSYTDPRGPDATREMVRFFQQHPHPAPR